MRPRTLVILLVVSAALNLFLVGAVVGGLVVAARAPAAGAMAGPRGGPLWTAGEALPPDQRRAFRRALRAEAPEARRRLQEARRLRREAWAELARPDFDRAAAEQALARARALELSTRTALESRLLTFAADLPPDQRRRLAEGLAEPRGREGEQRGRGPGGGP